MTDRTACPTGSSAVFALDRRERRGRLLGLIYLAFIIGPVIDLFERHTTAYRVVGAASLALFVFAYVRTFLLRGLFRGEPDSLREARAWTVVMVVLTLTLPLVLGSDDVGLIIFSCVLTALVVPERWAPAGIAGLALANIAVMVAAGSDSGTVFSLGLVSVLSPITVLAMRRLVLATRELVEAREVNARLAVSEERLRFARDLHDLLGHSLSLIVLKSELAGRLVDRDQQRVGAEVRDIESVARQALVEVREAVSGYRRSLDEELAGARSALEAAGIAVTLPERGAPLPAPVESLLGWAIREGTTNVLRHSRAGRVTIALDRDDDSARLAMSDDGTGPGSSVPGNGLLGLTERMTAAGGSVASGPGSGARGFRLTVSVPLDAPSYAAAPRPPEPASPAPR